MSQCLTVIIDSNINTLLNRMKSTVSIVLNSMHEENMTSELLSTNSSSFYMKELCNHLKVYFINYKFEFKTKIIFILFITNNEAKKFCFLRYFALMFLLLNH